MNGKVFGKGEYVFLQLCRESMTGAVTVAPGVSRRSSNKGGFSVKMISLSSEEAQHRRRGPSLGAPETIVHSWPSSVYFFSRLLFRVLTFVNCFSN